MPKLSIKLITLSAIFSLALTSCFTVSYTPWVSLDVSKTTIKKSVVVEKFVDNTSDDERKNPLAGFSVTNSRALTKDLNTEVTRAIASDFSANAVFEDVRLKNEDADYIIRGEIKKFVGKNRPTNGFWIIVPPFLNLSGIVFICGAPARISKVDIEIQLSVYDRSNHLVGTYSGVATDKHRDNIYNDKTAATISFVNKNFSKAVLSIREQIIKDAAKYK